MFKKQTTQKDIFQVWRQRVRIRNSRQDETPDRRYKGGMVRAQLAVPGDIFPGLKEAPGIQHPHKKK